MEYKSIIAISLVCALGAISPGPSLAVVVRNTVSGGRVHGVMTGIGHGVGLGIYALIAVMGLSSLLLANDRIFNTLQWVGAAMLYGIAFNMLREKKEEHRNDENVEKSRGFVDGFIISFFNPKILVFFVALFSQFIDHQMNNFDRLIMALIAGIIDTMWYVLVAVILAGTPLINLLKANSKQIDRLTGIILVVIASLLVVGI